VVLARSPVRRDPGTVQVMNEHAGPDALQVHGLRKTFTAVDDEQVPVRALRGIDIDVARGEFVAVMGPSGCGKSTLLNLVAGLETPTDGTITIDGEPIQDLAEDDLAVMRRRHIGIVFQFFNLLEGMSVLENVSLPMVVAGRSRKQADSRSMDLLDLLGIADKAGKMPGILSGGQRQRLSIARALSNEPTLLLADEPTGSLDSAGGAEVLGLFRRLHDGGQTIVMVTHADEVAASADRIVRMRDGRLDDRSAGRSTSASSPSGGVFGVLGEDPLP
jgi:putative ABC transport system ATP-binding protein